MIPTLRTGFHNVYVLMGCSTSTQMNLRLPEGAESTLHEGRADEGGDARAGSRCAVGTPCVG